MNVWQITILQGMCFGVLYGILLVIFTDICIRKKDSWIVRVIRNAGNKA